MVRVLDWIVRALAQAGGAVTTDAVADGPAFSALDNRPTPCAKHFHCRVSITMSLARLFQPAPFAMAVAANEAARGVAAGYQRPLKRPTVR